MKSLNIEEREYMKDRKIVKVTGWQKSELSELKSMEHYEASEKLIEMLDSRNNGLGSRLHNGYGIYGVWFDNEAAYLNCGTTCD